MALKRPVLVGGLGLSATLGILDLVHFDIFDSSTLLGAMAMGTGIWWWRQRDRTPTPPAEPTRLVAERTQVEAKLNEVQTLIETWAAEAAAAAETKTPSAQSLPHYQDQHQTLAQSLDRQDLSVAVVGESRSGKSTLIELLSAASPVEAHLAHLHLQEVPLALDQNTATTLEAYDAVLLVTTGDLTHSALDVLKTCVLNGQGGVLAFNKVDHYDPAARETVLHQLEHHVSSLPAPVPVASIAAAPRAIKVRRHQHDGTVTETKEPSPITVEPLYGALKQSLVAHTEAWVAATTLRQAEALRRKVQTDLNTLRHQRGQAQVDQLQWIAAAAAFANPVPTLDVLATVAISGQLIMDLGQIYGFKLTLEEAKTAAGTLAGLTVKLGLVELSTQVLTTVLKSHFATYVAGGVVQGLSAAYLTRMAGHSLMAYFEEAALAGVSSQEIAWEAIAPRLQSLIQQNGQARLLKNLAQQGIERLKPESTPQFATAE